ncbi:hypothetical protein HK405_015583, partial [Cladochytrium tenue]
MIAATGARAKISPLMAAAVPPLRLALGSKSKTVALSAIHVLARLGPCLGPDLLPHLPQLLPPVAAQAHSRDAALKEAVT